MTDCSVIVCTRNRVGALQNCLTSIVRSFAFADDLSCELILIDNGSTDDTSRRANDYLSRSGIRYRVEREEKPGLARARNAGLSHAAGDLLVFTDDDCELAPDYLRRAYDHFAADLSPVVRGGRVELGDPRDMAFTVITDPGPRRFDPQDGSQILGGFILGCNMTMPKALVASVGPFDARFGVGAPFRAAEDTDYLYRAHMAGFHIDYAPDMVVAHYHGRRDVNALRKVIEYYNEGEGAIYAKYLFGPRVFLRQLKWDVRDAWAETCLRRPVRDVFGVAKSQKLKSTAIGFWRYLSSAMSRGGAY